MYLRTLVLRALILPLVALLRVRSRGLAAESGGVVENIRSGLAYTRATPLIAATVGLVVIIQVLGMPGPGTLGPIWMTKVIGLSQSEFGWIAMIWGLGAVFASMALTRYPWLAPRGATLCIAALCFCVSAVVFGHSRSVPLTAVANFTLGVSLASTMLSGTAIAQAAVSDEMRGRVMGLFPLAMGLALLNAAPVSAVAQALSLSVVVPALAWVTLAAAGSLVVSRPVLRRYRGERLAQEGAAFVERQPTPLPAGGE